VKQDQSTSIKMNAMQWRIVLLCVWLNVIDGIDVMVAAFTANAIASEWHLTSTTLGWILSMGFVGMAAGSMLIAPLGDRWGRKPVLLFCLFICGLSMVAVALCVTPTQLVISRFISGMGIGGILASSNVLCNEYASKQNKGFAVSLLSVGYALGATLGGIIAYAYTASYGWRFVFEFAGVLTLLTGLLMIKTLHESMGFLTTKKDAQSRRKLQMILKSLPNGYAIESTHNQEATSHSWLAILKQGRTLSSLCLWCAIAFTMFGFQFMMSWTPKLITQSGYSAESGMSAGIVLSIGGMIGAVALGLLSRRFLLSRLQAIFLASTVLVTFCFMLSIDHPAWIMPIGFALGILMNGCVASLYALAPMLYPTHLRTTGVGFAMGLGRIGGILSPLVAGILLDLSWRPTQLYAFYAGAFALALCATLYLSQYFTHQLK
jgi:benzoate transport